MNTYALDNLESSILSLTGIEFVHQGKDFLHISQRVTFFHKYPTHCFEALFNPRQPLVDLLQPIVLKSKRSHITHSLKDVATDVRKRTCLLHVKPIERRLITRFVGR